MSDIACNTKMEMLTGPISRVASKDAMKLVYKSLGRGVCCFIGRERHVPAQGKVNKQWIGT